MKSIVIYYSRRGENYVNGSIVDLKEGNTEIAAKMIESLTGSDIFSLETEKEYSARYMECIAEAKKELRGNERPHLKALPSSLDEYDRIYLGYPNWWGSMPMCLFTFLESFDLSGKEIFPFCTNEGSGLGKSESDIKKLLPKSIVKKGLSIHGADVKDALPLIKRWLNL